LNPFEESRNFPGRAVNFCGKALGNNAGNVFRKTTASDMDKTLYLKEEYVGSEDNRYDKQIIGKPWLNQGSKVNFLDLKSGYLEKEKLTLTSTVSINFNAVFTYNTVGVNKVNPKLSPLQGAVSCSDFPLISSTFRTRLNPLE
jgi:hypothetical protein